MASLCRGKKKVHTTFGHFGIDWKRICKRDKKHESSAAEPWQGQASAKVEQQSARDQRRRGWCSFPEQEKISWRAMCNRLLSEEAAKVAHSLQLGNFVASSQYIKWWKQRFGVTVCHAIKVRQKWPEDFSEAFYSTKNTLPSEHASSTRSSISQVMTRSWPDDVRIDYPARRPNSVAGENTVHIANSGRARRGFTIAFFNVLHYVFFFGVEGVNDFAPHFLNSGAVPNDGPVTKISWIVPTWGALAQYFTVTRRNIVLLP